MQQLLDMACSSGWLCCEVGSVVLVALAVTLCLNSCCLRQLSSAGHTVSCGPKGCV